jgi:hypothetical protein
MIYYFWRPTEERIKFLKSLSFTQEETQTMDYEVLKVDTDKKTFQIVDKHYPESLTLITDFTKVIFEER